MKKVIVTDGLQEIGVEALRREGIDAVQTTVSRDIAQLGLVKVRNGNGRLVYALPGAADLDRLSQLTAAFRRWAISIAPGTVRPCTMLASTARYIA